MGAGKSTVGRRLSEQLDWPFVDTDQEIETVTGMSIQEIFRTRGEASFRQLELKVLDRLSRRDPPLIVACGGGLPVSSRNRRIMCGTGIPIYLKVNPETASKRVGDDEQRPLFRDPEQVRELWNERQEAYLDVPYTVDTESRSPGQVVEAVYQQLRSTMGEHTN